LKRLSRLLLLGVALLAGGCAPYVHGPGADLARPALNGSQVVTADSRTLPLRSWLPEGRPEAVIVALHGFNDYSNAYADAGRYWAGRGIATYAYDQRGFGAGADAGYWHGGERMAADLVQVIALVRERHPGTPLYVVGESMGGAVAMVAAAKANPHPLAVDGLVLSAPALRGREAMNVFERAGLWFFSHTVPWYTVSGSDLPFKIKASDNVEMLRALGKDPLVIKQTRVDAVHGLVDLMDAANDAAARLDLPTLVLYGENDEIVPPEPTYRMIGRLTGLGEERRVAIYPEGYHMLMRDLQAEVVLEDIATWVKNQRAPLPSGAEANATMLLADWGITPGLPALEGAAR